MGLAAVFAGISMLLIVLGFVYQLFLLVVAVPFVVTTYLLWDHASGRFEARVRRERRQRTRAGPNAAARGPNDFEGFGPGRRSAAGSAGGRGTGRRSRRTDPAESPNRPSPREAYRTLGLDPSATAEEVRDAYRAKVKEVHPDTESGSEEAFKRVNRAYERLSD